MPSSTGKRSRRTPFTQEEVKHLIALKKRRELIKLSVFKSSFQHKFFNIFNIVSFFIFWELILCFFGPCHYSKHRADLIRVHYASELDEHGKSIIKEMDVRELGGPVYKFIIQKAIKIPSDTTLFYIGKDFLLQKNMRAKFEGSNQSYRLFSGAPVLFLALFVSFISVLIVKLDLNQQAYPLIAVSILNLLGLFGIIFI